jgi:hypothetical protein
MHTQNVNVKTAGEETAGRWGKKPMRTDGFITNIHSRNPFDVIRADVVLADGKTGKPWVWAVLRDL